MSGETNELCGRANSLLATFCFWLGSIVFGIHIAAESAITASPTSYEHGPFAFVIGTCMMSVFLAFMAIAFLIAVIVSPKTPKRDARRLHWLSGSIGKKGADVMRSVIPFALLVVVVETGCPERAESVVDARKPKTSERQTENVQQREASRLR